MAVSRTWASSSSRIGIIPVPPSVNCGPNPAGPRLAYPTMACISSSVVSRSMFQSRIKTFRSRFSIPHEMTSCIGPSGDNPDRTADTNRWVEVLFLPARSARKEAHQTLRSRQSRNGVGIDSVSRCQSVRFGQDRVLSVIFSCRHLGHKAAVRAIKDGIEQKAGHCSMKTFQYFGRFHRFKLTKGLARFSR